MIDLPPDGSFLGAIYKGSVRYQRHDLRVEIIALSPGMFHVFAFRGNVSYRKSMNGRELLYRLREKKVSFESGWEVYQWQA